jgi:RimJ/RimL family protein N-acetyltransferase
MRALTQSRIETPRLTLRRPRRRDAQAIFDSYASDPDVTRNLTWLTHRSLADTQRFLDAADRGWATGADHPFLAWHGEVLVGATGLTRVGPRRLRTGYLVTRRLWGHGFASEMLHAMVSIAFDLHGASEVEALVEPTHKASIAILGKAGFKREGDATGVHPNLGPEVRRLERHVRVRQD